MDELIVALGGGGLSVSSVVCGGAKPDGDTRCFICPCRVRFALLLTMEAEDGETQFSDFILKGEIKK